MDLNQALNWSDKNSEKKLLSVYGQEKLQKYLQSTLDFIAHGLKNKVN